MKAIAFSLFVGSAANYDPKSSAALATFRPCNSILEPFSVNVNYGIYYEAHLTDA